jgi:hypothetical protein
VSLTETLTLLHITRAVFSSLHKAALRIGASEARQMERLVWKTALLIETVEIKMAGAKKRLRRPHTSEDWCEAPVKQIERLRRMFDGAGLDLHLRSRIERRIRQNETTAAGEDCAKCMRELLRADHAQRS